MISEYTPGPWTVIDCGNSFEISQEDRGDKGPDEIVHLGKIIVGTAMTSESSEPGITNRADAVLISAAPELLQALIRMVNIYDAMNGPRCPSRIIADAAIAKATGDAE